MEAIYYAYLENNRGLTSDAQRRRHLREMKRRLRDGLPPPGLEQFAAFVDQLVQGTLHIMLDPRRYRLAEPAA